MQIRKPLALATIAALLSGCSVPAPPIEKTSQVVATPVQGQLSVAVNKVPTVGDVVPVNISVANGTDISRAIIANQVFAINESGERVAPLPPGEAARQAGGAKELSGAVSSGAFSAVAAGALGAGVGAAVGAVTGGVGTGAMVGTAIGAGAGVFQGAQRGQDRARGDADQQLGALALPSQDVAHNFTVSGYVFFPKGDYREIEVLMINRETGDTETIDRPWP